MYPKISAIIPVYNASKILPFLIGRIIKQTFKDWELILVDDGSSDESLTICEKFASVENRIKVFHQTNQGPSVARNLGIESAKGEWITFVDSDDDLFDSFLESIYETTNDDVDLVYAGYLIKTKNDVTIFTYQTQTYIGNEQIKTAIAKTDILHRCSPWGKLFRRKILLDNCIRFNPKLWHSEDRLFLYDYLLHINGIATTSILGYIYDSSTVTSLKNKKNSIEMILYRQKSIQEAAIKLSELYHLNNEEFYHIGKHLIILLLSAIEGIYYQLGNNKDSLKEQTLLYNNLFNNKDFYGLINLKLYEHLSKNNILMKYLMEKQFKRINYYLSKVNLKIKIYDFIHKYIIKNKNIQTKSNIIYLN